MSDPLSRAAAAGDTGARRGWLRLATAAAVGVVVAFARITAVGLIIGHPVSGSTTTGTSVGRRSGASARRPSGTPPSPSATPSSPRPGRPRQRPQARPAGIGHLGPRPPLPPPRADPARRPTPPAFRPARPAHRSSRAAWLDRGPFGSPAAAAASPDSTSSPVHRAPGGWCCSPAFCSSRPSPPCWAVPRRPRAWADVR